MRFPKDPHASLILVGVLCIGFGLSNGKTHWSYYLMASLGAVLLVLGLIWLKKKQDVEDEFVKAKTKKLDDERILGPRGNIFK